MKTNHVTPIITAAKSNTINRAENHKNNQNPSFGLKVERKTQFLLTDMINGVCKNAGKPELEGCKKMTDFFRQFQDVIKFNGKEIEPTLTVIQHSKNKFYGGITAQEVTDHITIFEYNPSKQSFNNFLELIRDKYNKFMKDISE